MLVPGHVCSLYLATGGANGPSLGSDEKEIVLLHYTVIDVLNNEVSSEWTRKKIFCFSGFVSFYSICFIYVIKFELLGWLLSSKCKIEKRHRIGTKQQKSMGNQH